MEYRLTCKRVYCRSYCFLASRFNSIFTFSDMNKLNMISYAMLAQIGLVENSGIKHYRVKRLKIRSIPHMPILADGVLLGQGSLSVRMYPRALTVMAGSSLTGRMSTSKLTASKLTVNR